MFTEEPFLVCDSNKYRVLNHEGTLQMRQEFASESSILVDEFNYLYHRDQLLNICEQYFPKMKISEFNQLQRALDVKAEIVRESELNVRLF